MNLMDCEIQILLDKTVDDVVPEELGVLWLLRCLPDGRGNPCRIWLSKERYANHVEAIVTSLPDARDTSGGRLEHPIV